MVTEGNDDVSLFNEGLSRFLAALLPTENERGLLDLVAGVAVINGTGDELRDLFRHRHEEFIHRDAGPRERRRAALLETISHEHFHALQVMLCGSVYSVVVDIFDVLFRRINRSSQFTLVGFLEEAVSSFTEADLSEVDSALDRMFRTNSDGVSMSAIMESAAFLAQHRAHYPWLSADQYLSECLAPLDVESPYRSAFDQAHSRLGPEVFNTFPLLSMVSLNATEPGHAFAVLLRAEWHSWLHDVWRSDRDFQTGMRELKERAESLGIRFVGEPAIAMIAGRRHAVWTPLLGYLQQLFRRRPDVAQRAFCRPHEVVWDEEILDAISPLVVFRREGTRWPMWLRGPFCAEFSVDRTQADLGGEVPQRNLLTIIATSALWARLNGRLSSPARGSPPSAATQERLRFA